MRTWSAIVREATQEASRTRDPIQIELIIRKAMHEAIIDYKNTMNTKQTPIERLRHHVTGAIERGEKSAIVAVTDSGTAPSVADCQWFALCENPATTTREHSILGNVPICDRCNAKIERLSR